MTTPQALVRRGLLRFAPPSAPFPGRNGRTKPFLVDARGAGADPVLRAWIVEGLVQQLRSGPAFDVIGGIAKSGTSWAAWAAWSEGLPFANVLLDGARKSGLQREVEGDVQGRRVALIDNWTRSGGSIRRAAEVVARAGGSAVAAVTIVRDAPIQPGLPWRAVWDINDLLAAAISEGLVTPEFAHADRPSSES